MADIISATRRTLQSRSSNYEDLENSNEYLPQVLQQQTHENDDFLHPLQELEMNSVSVVPDGKFF